MALVLETGLGVPTANTYISATAWEAYADQMAWNYSSYTDEQKEAAIIRAARAVDHWAEWPGVRTYGRGQGLLWPRKAGSIQYGTFYADGPLLTITDREGLAIDDDEIPTLLVQAQAEAAWRELQDPGVLEPDLGQQIKSLQAGSVAITYADGASPRSSISVIDNILSGLLPERMTTGGAMVELLKA